MVDFYNHDDADHDKPLKSCAKVGDALCHVTIIHEMSPWPSRNKERRTCYSRLIPATGGHTKKPSTHAPSCDCYAVTVAVVVGNTIRYSRNVGHGLKTRQQH